MEKYIVKAPEGHRFELRDIGTEDGDTVNLDELCPDCHKPHIPNATTLAAMKEAEEMSSRLQSVTYSNV